MNSTFFYKSIFVFLSVVIAFGIATPALSQMEEAVIHEEIQENVTAADLEVVRVGMLPTSPLYFVKEWRRGLQRLLTFNPVAKAELELRFADEKAAELLQVGKEEEKNANESAAQTNIKRAMDNYHASADRLRERLLALQENSTNPNVARLIERVDDKVARHSMVFDEVLARMRERLSSETMGVYRERLQKIFSAAAEKHENIQQRAQEQIQRAREAMGELESALAGVADSAQEFEKPVASKNIKKSISVMSANANDNLSRAVAAFDRGEYGEAFGLARSAEVIARGGLRHLTVMETRMKNFLDKERPAERPKERPPSVCPQIAPACGSSFNECLLAARQLTERYLGCEYVSVCRACRYEATLEPKNSDQMACTLQYDPVCGADGKTYSNDCFAQIANVQVRHRGECEASSGEIRPGAVSQ